jgi:hypothetical protein
MGAVHNLALYEGSLHKFEKLFHRLEQNGRYASQVRHKGNIAWGPFLNMLVAKSAGAKFPVIRHPILVNPPIQLHASLLPPSANVLSLATDGEAPSKTGPVDPRPLPPFQPPIAVVTPSLPNGGPLANSGGYPANVATSLITVYQQYQRDPVAFSDGIPPTDEADLIVHGDMVGIQVHDSNPAEFESLTATLVSAGMSISSESATYGTIVGMLPINELLTVAQYSQTISVTPQYAPTLL